MTNLLLDAPPYTHEPTPEDIAFYAPFVDRMIDIIQPSVIVPLGAYATNYLLDKLDAPEKTKKITALHGKLIKAALPYGEIHALPMFHPAFAIRRPEQKESVRRDFEKLKLFI
jgi:DNA polymerase